MSDEEKTPLEKAEELNDMEDRDMTSAEADFHDRILKDLRHGKALKPKDAAKLDTLYAKYLGPRDEETEVRHGGGDEDEVEDDGDF
jgi:hypothetical protein